MNKTYYPIINGDNRKYKVQLIKSIVIITEIETNKIYLIKKYKNIFIGKNTKKYSQYKQLFTGSSILVEIEDLEYIYIGAKIFKFNTKEPIEKFYSIMGNSSVIYPLGLSKTHAYLILENVYILRDFGDMDPYEIYYDFKKIWKRKAYKFSSKKINLK
jgi:hypothetical protein